MQLSLAQLMFQIAFREQVDIESKFSTRFFWYCPLLNIVDVGTLKIFNIF